MQLSTDRSEIGAVLINGKVYIAGGNALGPPGLAALPGARSRHRPLARSRPDAEGLLPPRHGDAQRQDLSRRRLHRERPPQPARSVHRIRSRDQPMAFARAALLAAWRGRPRCRRRHDPRDRRPRARRHDRHDARGLQPRHQHLDAQSAASPRARSSRHRRARRRDPRLRRPAQRDHRPRRTARRLRSGDRQMAPGRAPDHAAQRRRLRRLSAG